MLSIQDLWAEVRGHFIRPPALRGTPPTTDDPDTIVAEALSLEAPPAAQPLTSLTGILIEIDYKDSKGKTSSRRITCRRLDRHGDIEYVLAYCHERERIRQFRCNRIQTIIDPQTGEIWDSPDEFFEMYQPDRERAGSVKWNLSVSKYNELREALIALVFMARCDSEWHPLETKEIERFITSYWLREEINAELHIDDILRDTHLLAPLAEDFFVALMRCAERPRLARLVRRAIADVIAADGHIGEEEFFWGKKVDNFLANLK